MFKLKLENRFGDTLELVNNKNYIVTNIDGLGPPKGRINLSEVAGMDGALFNSSSVEPRNIVLTVMPQSPVEENRLALYRYAQPGQWSKIYYSNGSVSVQIEGYVETVETGLFTKSESIQVSILCPQPYFIALKEIYTDISATVANFEFPFAVQNEGVEFSYINHDMLAKITNYGDVNTGIIIYITARGTVTNPVIYANDTGGSMSLAVTLQEHDQVVINTNTGQRSIKLITDSGEADVINRMSPNPQWFILAPGENVFSYSADSGMDLMSVKFAHHTKYGGV